MKRPHNAERRQRPLAHELRWLLLIHQIPASPAYLRVKVGRRLARAGAAQLKSSVYVLPNTDTCREDFSWIRREIVAGGGDASVLEALTLEGLTGTDLERMFGEARAADYRACQETLDALSSRSWPPARREEFLGELLRLEQQVAEVERIDFFPHGTADALRMRINETRTSLQREAPKPGATSALRRAAFQRRTWVTRSGVKVDRVACAWLIRRFIDKAPKFRFVEASTYIPKKNELRFDMPEAEFTHEGDLCSFEVLCQRFALAAPGLTHLAEIIHDLDVKDGRYGHPETQGIAVLIQGLIAQHAHDEARVEAASSLFDTWICADQSRSRSKR